MAGPTIAPISHSDTETTVGATKAFPLERWVYQQRKALRAGELEDRRKVLLDAPEAGDGVGVGRGGVGGQIRLAAVL
ncbi:helicase associated domain-containing protein [Streptomyces sp. NPDC001546]|uniref:helicase associated domain-containing protein n=1 Tax=Streptomyces sp. NPDC001546 TaxID=3364585 RepID=UPI0036AD50C0